MPLLNADNYNPPFFLRNGHTNTMFPFLFRKKGTHFQTRKRYHTPDGDFMDVDWCVKPNQKRLAVLLHGLEGSSSSQYIVGATAALSQNSFDIAAINFRSCSGEMNLLPVSYHSGWTDDLHHFLTTNTHAYVEIFICGFSLGGNVTLKYGCDGRYRLDERIKAIAGISVPCDLRGSSKKIMEYKNYLYEQAFLKTLKEKMKLKHLQFPDKVDISQLKSVKTLWDFDEYFTAPVHGFDGAEHYYHQCNSLQYLAGLTLPTLMVNALDDTFLSPSCYPFSIAKDHQLLTLMTPRYGGHVGFTTFGSPHYWTETVILDFFERHSASKW
jgi:predicted alpha/beta-fold hydrolase